MDVFIKMQGLKKFMNRPNALSLIIIICGCFILQSSRIYGEKLPGEQVNEEATISIQLNPMKNQQKFS